MGPRASRGVRRTGSRHRMCACAHVNEAPGLGAFGGAHCYAFTPRSSFLLSGVPNWTGTPHVNAALGGLRRSPLARHDPREGYIELDRDTARERGSWRLPWGSLWGHDPREGRAKWDRGTACERGPWGLPWSSLCPCGSTMDRGRKSPKPKPKPFANTPSVDGGMEEGTAAQGGTDQAPRGRN